MPMLLFLLVMSPPARVAWIETYYLIYIVFRVTVATREGGVDRNSCHNCTLGTVRVVATREGGVDRNPKILKKK